MHRNLIAEQLEPALRESLEAPRLRLLGLDGERPACDERREPWIPIKYGPAHPDDWFGVVPATARFERSPRMAPERLGLVVKVNPRAGLARNLIPWIIAQQNIKLDRPYWEYRSAAESDHTGHREHHVYGVSAKETPSLRAVLHRYYGSATDLTTGEHALLLEFVLDWELAECNTAHRDIVEMLTFVLPTATDRAQIDNHIETHRAALVAAGASRGVERDIWIEGFRCELKVEAINRVGLQLLFAAKFPLAYLDRINATIAHLLDLYG